MFDEGSGPPLIVVPGVQGRWEWMLPAVRELKAGCRTISYTLCGDYGSRMRFDPALGFDNYIDQLDAVFDKAGVERAAVCGVSYGGFIALQYAATRRERVSALILVSAPSPGWTPSRRQQRYIARPWLSTPLFMISSPMRVWREIRTALPDWRSRVTFSVAQGARVLKAPMIPSQVAGRMHLQQRLDFGGYCEQVTAPTLIVTGEDQLDWVVPPPITRRYLSLIAGARYEKLDRTGHIGMLTHSRKFAQIVTEFVHAHSD